MKTPLIHLEDLFITGVVGYDKCGFQLIDDKKHFQNMGYDLPCKPMPNQLLKPIIIHNVNNRQDMHLLHNVIVNNTTMIDCNEKPYIESEHMKIKNITIL